MDPARDFRAVAKPTGLSTNTAFSLAAQLDAKLWATKRLACACDRLAATYELACTPSDDAECEDVLSTLIGAITYWTVVGLS